MAIINKDRYLRDIARHIGKGEMSFEQESRVGIEVGGTKAFVKGVAFDAERGEITYELCDDAGKVYTSSRGPRPLSGLGVRDLSKVSRVVTEAARIRSQRMANIVNIRSRLSAVRGKGAGIGL